MTLPAPAMLHDVSQASYSANCPSCGQAAPVVLRDFRARCAACGAVRMPFAARSVTLAGQPSRVGGMAATVAGSAILIIGLSLALLVGLLAQSFWPASFIGWAIALPIAVLSLSIGLLLLMGGRRLHRHGGETQRSVQLQAIRAIVQHRGGSITAADAARALNMSETEADALLTEIAKDPAANVSIDVDEHGRIRYDFDKAERRWRVLDETANAEDAEARAEAEAALSTLPIGSAAPAPKK